MQGFWKHFLDELKCFPCRAVIAELLHCCTVPGRVGRSPQCSCTVWNRDAGLDQTLSWAGWCWNPVHSDAQNLGKKSVLHSIRPMGQVFVYLIPRVRGIAPPQTHLSILCTVLACIHFLLNVHIFPSQPSYCSIFSNDMTTWALVAHTWFLQEVLVSLLLVVLDEGSEVFLRLNFPPLLPGQAL